PEFRRHRFDSRRRNRDLTYRKWMLVRLQPHRLLYLAGYRATDGARRDRERDQRRIPNCSVISEGAHGSLRRRARAAPTDQAGVHIMKKAKQAWLVLRALHAIASYDVICWLWDSGRILRQVSRQSTAAKPDCQNTERAICDAVLLATCLYWKPVL